MHDHSKLQAILAKLTTLERKNRALLLKLWLSLAYAAALSPAYADYALSQPEEKFFVLADNWQLNDDDLTIVRQGKSHHWKINRLYLADRELPGTLCLEPKNYMNATRMYLLPLRFLPRGSLALVELCAMKKDGAMFVADISKLDSKSEYERACKGGNRILELTADQVKKLKSESAYMKEWYKANDRIWQSVESHH